MLLATENAEIFVTYQIIIKDELPILLEVNSVPALGPNTLVERQVILLEV